jgi:hypothetical protein
MSDDTKVTSLEGAFLVPSLVKRRKAIASMVEALELPEPHGTHLLAAGFIERDSSEYLHLHIDVASGGGKRASRDAQDYLVMLQLRDRPKGAPPKNIRDRKQDVSWAMERVEKLLGSDETVCFLEVELTMRNRERPPLPRPIVVHDEVVPAVGAEYAIPPSDKGLRRLRWRVESPSKNIMSVWISYALPYDGEKALREWLVDGRTLVTGVAEEVFANV